MRAAWLQLLRFVRDPFAIAVLVGVLAVPAIYGGVLVWGYWDPYARTDRIPAAFVNLDQPVTVNGEEFAAGDSLEHEVLQTDSLDWTVTTPAAAAQGLEDKTYYVVVTVPQEFSAQMSSIHTDQPRRGEIEVRTNDAGNYLVGVLAKDAASSVQGLAASQVQGEYLDVVYDLIGAAKEQSGTVTGSAQELADGTQQASDAAAQVADGAAQVSDGVRQVADALDQVDQAVQDAPAAARDVQEIADEARDGVTSALTAADGVITRLENLQAQLQAAGQPDAANAVGDILATFESSVATPLADAASTAGDVVDQADRLAGVADDAVRAADQADAQVQQLADGAGQVADGAGQLASSLADQLAPGARQLSDGLAQAAQQLDAPLTQADRETFTKVLSQPVQVDRERDNPIAHFGDGFSSYFAGLGLFVGAVFVFLVLPPLDRRLQLWGARPVAVAAPPLLAGSVIVLLQAALLFGALVLTGVRGAAMPALLGVFAASSVSYVALLQLLKAAFGLVGEFVGVVVLVLQVAAGEGAYPIQTFGAFFQAVHPYLPMSYTNDGVRRTIAGGPLQPYVWVDVAVLLGVAVVAFLLTWLVAARRRRYTVAGLRPSVELT